MYQEKLVGYFHGKIRYRGHEDKSGLHVKLGKVQNEYEGLRNMTGSDEDSN